jgi:hypothetical protein
MAEQQILNLDDILAEEPRRTVRWRGQDYEVAGLTGETYLKFLQTRGSLQKAQKEGDEARQWEDNFRIIGIVVPGLAEHTAELKQLKLPVLNKLVSFVMSEFTAGAEAGAATDNTGGTTEAGAGQPGEAKN